MNLNRVISNVAIGFVAVALLAGCTESQLRPFRKAATATTQATTNPAVQVVAAATGTSPYVALVSLVGNVALGVMLILEKRKKTTTP
jgi:hypothetical protein